VMAYGLIVASLAGCAAARQAAQPAPGGAAALPAYRGPKARISVAGFDVEAAKANSAIGSGLRQMLTDALTGSDRFNVVERQNKHKTPDIIISVAVMEFEPQPAGGSAGIGGGGAAAGGILGGLLGGGLNKAYIALDIRIIDAPTSEVLAARRVQGQASEAAGGFMAGLFGRHGLAAYANTPMEKAIRICISEAVRYIWEGVPKSYYRY